MIRQRRTLEGEIIPHQIYDMELPHLRNDQLFFPQPTIVEHIINSRSPLYGEQNNRLIIYRDYQSYQTYPIEYQKQEINKHIQILQQWLENNIEKDSINDETDIYFDCADQQEFGNDVVNQNLAIKGQDHLYDNNLVQISTTDQSWISEIWLSIHRRTGLLRRFLNCFNQSSERSLTNIVEEFVRIHGGSFNHPIGSRFHVSDANEKWLLILKNIKFVKYPIYPYPQTRIILIRKGVSFIAR
ncbi:unnamed protein product [Rotaria sp. Silwood1]|nr:unnamed protein product [Rotaria sp. Silwood1]CAF4607568.1 unnamed protein product [Rotaria sp. Silwood1]